MRARQIPLWNVLILAAIATVPASSELRGQTVTEFRGQRALVLQGGGWLVDWDGTVAAARAELPIGRTGRWLLVPGLTYAHGDLRSPTRTGVVVPEAQVHFQLARGRVRPYVGGGAGFAFTSLADRTVDEMVMIASGLRMDLTPQWGARLEADMRMFGQFTHGTIGWGLGVARRF